MFIEKHHIVFKSQGGLDFDLNYKYLDSNSHRGNLGPHKNKETELKYKLELQEKLESLLTKEYYNIKELIDLLGLQEKQANRAFRKLLKVNGIDRETILRRLMGGRLY